MPLPKTPEQLQADFLRQRQQGPRGMPSGPVPGAAQPMPTATTAAQRGPRQEAPQPAPIERRAGPSGFVTFSQQLAANRDVAQRMAQQAGNQVEDNGASTALLKNDAGRQALLQKAYGQATELDAAMAGAASPNYYAQLEAQYGPEAQQRAAAAALAEAKRQADANAKAQREAEARAKAETEQEARDNDPAAKAERIRAEDAQRPRGQMGKERWANLHGLTLEQWLANGQQPPF